MGDETVCRPEEI